MKKFAVWVAILSVGMTVLSGCRLLNMEKIKVIDKQTPGSKTTQGKNNADNNNLLADKTDLGDKGKVLQADTEEYMESIIKDRATQVLKALKEYDLEKLSMYAHPEKGVRFTPYSYVDVDKDLVFDSEKLKKLGTDSTLYLWGNYDGSGEPIELTFSDYYKRFIFDVDFLTAPKISYNKTLSQGNTVDNSFEVYKNAIIVEYYFPEFEKQFAGMDWRSLKLAFEKVGDTWYLVGIIHGQWTI